MSVAGSHQESFGQGQRVSQQLGCVTERKSGVSATCGAVWWSGAGRGRVGVTKAE